MITNGKKRKLDEYDIDNNDTSNRKKRKLNTLIEANETTKKQIYELEKTQKQLKKQNKNLKQGVNVSKKEANKWKSKYMKLYSMLQQLANHSDLPEIMNKNTLINDIDFIKKNRNIKSKSKNRNMKSNHNNNINKRKQYDRNFKQQKRKNNSQQKRKGEDKFENSYHMSVNCHICDEHFDNFNLYGKHIKKHYDSDTNKTWKLCDFPCKREPDAIFGSNIDFISHISQHTNDKPFKCDFILDGIKCDAACGTKGSLKSHWKTHFTNNKKHPLHSTKQRLANAKTDAEFEKNYIFSIHCHICSNHFDDIVIYKQHLKKHYKNDHLRTWLTCELGCKDVTSVNTEHFICHIASHTKKYPYHCIVPLVNGNKCKVTAGTKSNLKRHWTRSHCKSINESDESSSSSSSSSSESEIVCESPMETDFENSYYISINCHLCNKHFNDFYSYWLHIKKHYINDGNKEWLRCDFGACKKKCVDTAAFICHIASHTQSYPFKCGKCSYSTSQQTDMKTHWLLCMKKYTFENSYYVSVDCYICNKHFNDYIQYKFHIKEHFVNDSCRTWRECPFGCMVGGKKKTLSGDEGFIYHISTHTKDFPFKCNVIVNGTKCSSTAGIPSGIKRHFRLAHKDLKVEENKKEESEVEESESESVSESDYESSSSFQQETVTSIPTNNKRLKRRHVKDMDFEKSYYISVNCHFCSKHFSNLGDYKVHIKKHYHKDPKKNWLWCQFGCNKKMKDTQSFIYHIASHTKDYPFKCGVMVNGKKCSKVSGQKSGLKVHWQSVHNRLESDESDSSLESDYESSQLESESDSEGEENNCNDLNRKNKMAINTFK